MASRSGKVAAGPQGAASRWKRAAIATTLGGLVLGVLGPFGSYLDGGMLARSTYWIGAMWLGLILYGSGVTMADQLARPGSWRRWVFLGLSILAASIPQAAVTRMVAVHVWPGLLRYGPDWWSWYVQAATVGAIAVCGVTASSHAWPGRFLPPPASTHPGGETAARPGWPAWLPQDVIALQMEDHYVRVHTPRGSTLVHMKLTQAIEQLDTLEGLRTHRSWWIARHAVTHVEGTPRSMRLCLRNGLSAPVARSAVTVLRQAGWLKDASVT